MNMKGKEFCAVSPLDFVECTRGPVLNSDGNPKIGEL